MTAEQLVVGNKYVPFQKTIGLDFLESDFIRHRLPYVYYKGYNSRNNKYVFSMDMDTVGDYYNPEDVYEYIESFQQRIFRGSKIQIINNGGTYTTHSEMFNQLGFINKTSNYCWDNGTEGIVFGIAQQTEDDVVKTILAVRDNSGNECLINADYVGLAEQQKEGFILPEKWQIEITPHNANMLIDWRGLNITSRDDNAYMLCDVPNGHHASVTRGFVSTTKRQDYTEITTEQFKQYVLNQKPTETTTEFVLPEKWAIAVTAENKDEISVWRAGALYDTNGYCLSIHQGYWVESLGRRYEDYTLISTEIFRKYVLNQTLTDMPTQEQTPQTKTKQYPKTPEGLYDMTLDMLNLEKGDIVKVTHKTPGHYMGWSNSWCPDMDAMIGNEYEVSRISDTRYGVSLKDHPFNFPPYSLEFVRKGGQEESYHIANTIGRLKYGVNEYVKFDQPITELAASDVYWLAKLFVKQNRRDDIRLADL